MRSDEEGVTTVSTTAPVRREGEMPEDVPAKAPAVKTPAVSPPPIPSEPVPARALLARIQG